MSFFETVNRYASFDFGGHLASVTTSQVESILDKDRLSELDYLALLSESAVPLLESMAQKANRLTRMHFGNVMFIFTPLYVSNHCDNGCPYCSFARQHRIARSHLTVERIRKESLAIARTGMRHILVLTGESRSMASPEYVREAVSAVAEHFSSVSVEVYPMTRDEYAKLIMAGTDGITMFQETYYEPRYHALHHGGPKDNYRFRLDAPERAVSAGARFATVGALLGLYECRSESFLSGLHAQYLQRTFPELEVSIAFPRLRPMVREFEAYCEVNDRLYVQMLLAARLFLPRCGITVSTRESRELRNAIAPLGVTKMSAGVSTAVGGHGTGENSTAQFEIADTRTLDEMRNDLRGLGFQAVMHDWSSRYVKA